LLFAVLFVYMGYSIWRARQSKADHLIEEVEQEMVEHNMTKAQSIFWIVLGLALLIASSRALVWGAVGVAEAFGVSELIIGLTVVAVGTSLPELVSSIVAARKGEYDMVLGNIIGSNFFNMLAVVGVAAVIQPLAVGQDVLQRDVPVMVGITVLLFAVCWLFKAVNRYAGAGFVAIYVGYTLWLINTAVA
jgi:cation:H+ antiporter